MRQTLLFCCGLIATGGLGAQTVYEAPSGKGKIYSDQPIPGGKPVVLRPLTVIESPPVAAPAPASTAAAADNAKPDSAASAYRSLAVVFPEANGSVAANNATFEVRVSIDPPLQVVRGHAFALRLDGRNVPGRYTATEMMVPPEFFGNVAPAGVQQHVLEASVVDAQGGMLIAAPPVSFQTRFVTVLQRPHSLQRQPRATPVPPSESAPAELRRPAVEPRR
jgi:hypothetical protein